MPSLTDEERELLKWLKETAEKYDVEIEMPTHDHITFTGRITPALRQDLELHWTVFGRQRMFRGMEKGEVSVVCLKPRDPIPRFILDLPDHYFGRRRTFSPSVPIDPELVVISEPYRNQPFNIDYEQLELRIAALTRPGIETVELGGRKFHRIKHPYGGPSLEVPCRSNSEDGCPTCKLLEQLAVDRKNQMLKKPEEQGTEVECKDCKQTFIVSEGEEKFLREKFGDDFAWPVRCKPCREANKKRKAQEAYHKHDGAGPRRKKR